MKMAFIYDAVYRVKGGAEKRIKSMLTDRLEDDKVHEAVFERKDELSNCFSNKQNSYWLNGMLNRVFEAVRTAKRRQSY